MKLETCKKCGNLLGIAEKDYCGQCKPEVDEEALDEILLKQIIESRGKEWIINQLK